MCLNMDRGTSTSRNSLGSRSDKGPKRSSIRLLAADGVRACRLRRLIERCVIAAVGPSGTGRGRRPPTPLLLLDPARGGSQTALARQLVMYTAHVTCRLTYAEAAALYHRHAKTAAYACHAVEDRREDRRFDFIVELLEQSVRLGLRQVEPAVAAALEHDITTGSGKEH